MWAIQSIPFNTITFCTKHDPMCTEVAFLMTSQKIQIRGKPLTPSPQQLTFDFPIPDGFHAFMRVASGDFSDGTPARLVGGFLV